MLAEKVLQLELSAPHSVSIPAGEAQGFTPYCSARAAIFGHEENDGLQDSPRAGCPCGEEEMDVRSRRVSSTHAWRGKRSRRSDISSSGLVGLRVGTTRTRVVGLVAAVLTLATNFYFDFPAAG